MQLRDFDINLLTTLEAIWMTRNVSAAAKTLNLAQSTVSAALNRLRASLDDDLFNWTGSEMVPTPLAEQIMPDVVRLLANVRGVLEKSHGRLASVERRVVIATVDYVVALIGPELLARAAAEAPNLSFDFVDMKPQTLTRATRPDVDMFIIPSNALRIAGLKRRLLYSDTYVCVGALDNEALYEGMPADAFLALPHIGYSATPRTTVNHETMLWDELDAETGYRLTMGNYLVFPHIAAQTNAVAILPKRLAVPMTQEKRLKFITPPLPTPDLPISALWKPAQEDDVAVTWLREAVAAITSDWR
ncbi:LysR family transcriptional regulator [Sphingomonas sp. CL5.1]|uniref:LysR family transcriptional regulator n=1 Tax=Sphingomonas sp. CL5.1 TaxID=2653203 RepID=UPI001581D007|nr:LysR family transcriptional regulator [Sphingomonas sp. CL5.1]QKS01145.1 LysR family transcriptional regulator [Sphingomonas sp. CL5.1]